MEVWQFEKIFADRLNDYQKVFDNVDQNSSIVSYSNVWAAYLSNILQQFSWIGLWCPSHKECFEYGLPAAVNTNVSVKKIDYDSLIAHVTVHPDQLYFHKLSDTSVKVPLSDLYVAKRQNNDEVDWEAVASSLDMLRIFYHYLIWPWDEEDENDCFVNCLSKIESRLGLYYDIVDGILNRVAQKDFISLVSRGKKLYERIRMLPSDFAECDEGLSISMNLYGNLKFIQNMLQRYEDPKTRSDLNFMARLRQPCPGCHIILPESCNIRSTVEIFGRIKEILPHADYKGSSRNLNNTLRLYGSDETIVISSGTHCVDSQRLDLNVTLCGLDDEQQPTVADETPYWYFLKMSGDNVILRNLIINLRLCQAAIFVCEGVTELDSVIMKVERSIKSVAIVVEYNASLVANRCRFVDFDVAVFCLSGSAVELTNCIFENNETCIEIMPGAQVCMMDCDLSLSKDGGVKYNGGFDKDQLKSLDSLSEFDIISFRSLKLRDESKAVLFV